MITLCVYDPQLLEKALSGYDATKEGKEGTRGLKDTGKGSRKKSKLVPDPHPTPEVSLVLVAIVIKYCSSSTN